jgi:hypothetical protein
VPDNETRRQLNSRTTGRQDKETMRNETARQQSDGTTRQQGGAEGEDSDKEKHQQQKWQGPDKDHNGGRGNSE